MSTAKILVADDSKTVRIQVKRVLIHEGFEVIEASDGVQAIELAKEAQPNLAIIDIDMPHVNGYGVCQQLKQLGSPYDQIPIILLTSATNRALEMLGDQLGAYFRKPVDEEQLLEKVASLITQDSQAAI